MPRHPFDTRSSPEVRTLSPLRDFLRAESSGGVLLVVAAAIALLWANSPWRASYEHVWSSRVAFTAAGHTLDLDVRHWVNDGFMTVFFLVVGLEIKRELTGGYLATRRAAALPVVAALGGMAVPALVYLAIAGRVDGRGWGVPMATDIALAVGLLALAGSRVPGSQRAFLLGLAIVDDIGAIVIIAAVYSSGVSWASMALAAGATVAVVAVRALGAHTMVVYVALGTVVWLALHEAGVHPTLAGVAMGLLAPTTPRIDPEWIDVEELTDLSSVERVQATRALARSSVSVVEWLQHVVHPWTSYLIVPVFALANAGVAVSASSLGRALRSPVAWGVFAGLVVGKPVGVVVASKAAARAGWAELPRASSWRSLLGIGNAAGVGFTVALFITELAFTDPTRRAEAKIAILAASAVSAVVAVLVLRGGSPGADPAEP